MIPHLAHDDHVRILAKNVDERAVERMGVRQHFLLHNNGVFVPVDEFDRVFHGHDFATALRVDQINHVVERSRLASAGWTGDQHQTIRFAREVIDLRGQTKLFPRRNSFAAKAQAQFRMAVPFVNRRANSSRRGVRHRNTQFPLPLELGPLLWREQ